MTLSLKGAFAALAVAAAVALALPAAGSAAGSEQGTLLKRQPAGMSFAAQKFQPKCPPKYVAACRKNEVRVCAQTDAKGCCVQVYCEPK